MKRIALIGAAVTALYILSGCSADTGADNSANNTTSNAPVVMPHTKTTAHTNTTAKAPVTESEAAHATPATVDDAVDAGGAHVSVAVGR